MFETKKKNTFRLYLEIQKLNKLWKKDYYQ